MLRVQVASLSSKHAWEAEVIMPAPGRRCPECATPMVIHQPDTRLPDRLLGTCPNCRTWCLQDGDLDLVAILPTHGLPERRTRLRPRRPPIERRPRRHD